MQPTSPLVRQSVLYQGWPRARVNYFFSPPTPFPRLISTFSTFLLSLLLTQSSNSNINILTNLISFLFRILKFYLQFQTFLSPLTEESLKEEEKEREKILYPKYIPGNYELEKRKGKERTDSNRSFSPPPPPLLPPRRNNLRVRKGRGGENGRNEELNDACPPRPTESRCRINSRNSLWGGGEERRG